MVNVGGFSNTFDLGKINFSGVGSSIGNFWDKFKNGNTNDVNYKISEENLAFQRENLEYQKALQQKIFDREDSSYQRTVNDMRQAGLSPLAMNGLNGAGEAIQTEAPQRNFQMQNNGFSDIVNYATQLHSAYQTSKMNTAQINNLDSLTDYQNIINAFTPANLAISLVGQLLQNKSTSQSIKNQTADYGLKLLQTLEQSYRNQDTKRWNTFASQYGISSNMTEKERLLKLGQSILADNDSGIVKTKIVDPVVGAIRELQGEKGMADTLSEALPQSWRDRIDEYFNDLGKKADSNYAKHGFRFWKWE